MSETGYAELTTTSAKGVAGVPPAAWDALAAGTSLYSSWRWLAADERFRGHPTPHLQVRTGGDLVGVLLHEAPDSEFNALCDPAELWPGSAPPASAFVHLGSRRGYHNHVLLPPAHSPAVARAAAEAVRDAAASTGRALLAQYVPLDAVPALTPLFGEDALVLPVAFDAVLTVPAGGAGWPAAVSKRRRTAIRHEREVFRSVGYDVACEPVHGCLDELAPLMVGLQRKYGHAASPDVVRRLIAAQAEQFGADALVFTARDGGALVGFALALVHGGELYVRMAGFDYARLHGAFEYFNLGMYEPVDYACRHGLGRVHLGIESYHGKRLRGASLVPLATVLPASAVPDPDRLAADAWARIVRAVEDLPRAADAFAPLTASSFRLGGLR